jgi:hypothetical protein
MSDEARGPVNPPERDSDAQVNRLLTHYRAWERAWNSGDATATPRAWALFEASHRNASGPERTRYAKTSIAERTGRSGR